MTKYVSGAQGFRSLFAKLTGTLLQRLRQSWSDPPPYRPGEHYMRGPGPKWHEKHGPDRTAVGLVQQPMTLGEKWDF
jgi:hypothetical protein